MDTEPARRRGWAGGLWLGLLAFVLGTGLQLQQSALYPAWAYTGLLLLALACPIVLSLAGRLGGRLSCLLLLSCALSGFGLTGWRASFYGDQALLPQLEGRDVLVTGLVAGMPQWHESGLRFRLALETASAQGVAVRLPEKIDLSWYSGPVVGAQRGVELQVQPQALRAGERWQMMVRLKAPHGASNPHGFDYELWLWEQGVQATGYVRAGRADPPPVRLADTPWYPVERLRQRLREQIFAAVPERSQAGLIAALVVGDQRAIERSDWDLFRATGVAHLMSISGLHITMFAWAAALAVGWLWRRSAGLCRLWPAPSAALLGGMLLAGAYALFSGWGVPAQRTVLMLASVGLLRLAGKRWPWPMVWLLACTVVVVADPWAMLQAGFWLSFVAVGVLFASSLGTTSQSEGATTPAPGRPKAGFAPPGGSAAHAAASVGATAPSVGATESTAGPPQGGLAPPGGSAARAAASVGATSSSEGATTPPPGRPKAGFAPPGGSAAHAVASVGAIFHEQWVITLALTPLTLLLFGQVSLVGLLANGLAIPWVTLVVTPLAMLGTVLPGLWQLTAVAIGWMSAVLQFLADLPLAVLWVPQAPLWAGAVGVMGGLLLVLRLPWQWRSIGLPLLLPVLLWQAPQPPMGEFEVLAADVGQGNGLIVRTRHHAMVYDAGPRFSSESDAGHRVMVPLLRAMGTQLDLVVLSHRDSDHVGGAAAVLAQQPQAQLLSSLEPGHMLQALRPGRSCLAGQSWRWDGVDFLVLHPRPEDYAAALRPNALSCTLRISNGRQTALLAGDIEQAQEALLVASGAPLRATLLLVPHHGSKTSSSEAFLDAVSPSLALVQSGYRNRFGHPADPVLARYADRQILVFDSPHCGAMTWRSVDAQQVQCQRQTALRYWHHRVP